MHMFLHLRVEFWDAVVFPAAAGVLRAEQSVLGANSGGSVLVRCTVVPFKGAAGRTWGACELAPLMGFRGTLPCELGTLLGRISLV